MVEVGSTGPRPSLSRQQSPRPPPLRPWHPPSRPERTPASSSARAGTRAASARSPRAGVRSPPAGGQSRCMAHRHGRLAHLSPTGWRAVLAGDRIYSPSRLPIRRPSLAATAGRSSESGEARRRPLIRTQGLNSERAHQHRLIRAHNQALRSPRHGDIEIAGIEVQSIEDHRRVGFQPFQ